MPLFKHKFTPRKCLKHLRSEERLKIGTTCLRQIGMMETFQLDCGDDYNTL